MTWISCCSAILSSTWPSRIAERRRARRIGTVSSVYFWFERLSSIRIDLSDEKPPKMVPFNTDGGTVRDINRRLAVKSLTESVEIGGIFLKCLSLCLFYTQSNWSKNEFRRLNYEGFYKAYLILSWETSTTTPSHLKWYIVNHETKRNGMAK